MKEASQDRETRERLLKAAEHLFAERGFKAVTVREICQAARANVAAINYHFGDKLGLYREVLQVAIDAMRESTDAARRAGEGQRPEEQLRRFIRIFLHRVLAPGHENVHKLIDREIREPTAALDDLIDHGVRPRLDYLSGVISQLLDCDRSDPRVLWCMMSVQSQAVMYARPHKAVAERLGFHMKRTPAEIDQAAEHIADFSIGGIRRVARAVAAR